MGVPLTYVKLPEGNRTSLRLGCFGQIFNPKNAKRCSFASKIYVHRL